MWVQQQDVLLDGIHAIHVGDSGRCLYADGSGIYLDCAFLVRDDALGDDGFFRGRADVDARFGFDVLRRLRAEGRVSGLTLMLGASSLMVLIRVISLSLTLRVQPLDLAKDLKYVPACVTALAKSSVLAWK